MASSSTSKRVGVKGGGGYNRMDDDEDKSVRKSRLDLVYSKAIDVSINALNDESLKDCFGDVKDKLGNALHKSFFNMLGETSTAMEGAFKSACIKRDLDERLHALESMPVSPFVGTRTEVGTGAGGLGISGDEDPMEAALLEIKMQEMQNLQIAIEQLERESKQLGESLEKSRHELGNSIAALKGETAKMAAAAGHTPY